MMNAAVNDPRPFLSVIAWPTGASRASMAQLIAETTGIDAPTLRLRLGQAPPSIIGQVDPPAAARAIEAIRAEGGDAFAVTFAELISIGPARPVRSMSVANGVVAMELRNGDHAALRFTDAWLLVQGMIRERGSSSHREPVPHRLHRRIGRSSSIDLAMQLGAAGIAAMLGDGYLAGGSAAIGHADAVKTRNKLHIHDASGTIYEVEGRRFNFNVLGEMKQYSDRANMEQLCELLSHLAPDEIVDPYFPLWKPPPRYHKLRIEGEKHRADRPFAFYSRWAACLYRHLINAQNDAMFTDDAG